MRTTANQYYEDGLDELLMSHNPTGGRPKRIGSVIFADDDRQSTYEVDQIKEETSIRYMLGYCVCGRKIIAGEKRAAVLAAAFEKRNIKAKIPMVPLRLRIARRLVSGVAVDK